MRRHTRTWVGRVAAAALVTFALAYIPYHVYALSGLKRTLALRHDLASLRGRNHELAAENERLAREADALRSDPAAIERVARAELGWVKPGEVLVDLAGVDTAGADQGTLRASPNAAAPGQGQGQGPVEGQHGGQAP